MIRLWLDLASCFACDSFFYISSFSWWDIFYLSSLVEILFFSFYFNISLMWFAFSKYFRVLFVMCSLYLWLIELFWRWSIVQTNLILFQNSRKTMLSWSSSIVLNSMLVASSIEVILNCFVLDSHSVVSIAQDFD